MPRKLLFIPFVILLLVSTACVFSATTPTPEVIVQVVTATSEPAVGRQPTAEPPAPTEMPAPTDVPAPTQPPEPTTPPEPDGPQPFEEGWDDPETTAWVYEYIAGTDRANDIFIEDSRLKIELNTRETYAYVYNSTVVYDDVIVAATVENKGDSTNGIALTCRMSDRGWYELRFSSGSYFYLYRYDQLKKDKGQVPYVELVPQTVIREINPGWKKNTVALSCIGDEIRFYFNGTEILYQRRAAIVDDTYSSGNVGVGVMSFTNTGSPVRVEFEDVIAELP